MQTLLYIIGFSHNRLSLDLQPASAHGRLQQYFIIKRRYMILCSLASKRPSLLLQAHPYTLHKKGSVIFM